MHKLRQEMKNESIPFEILKIFRAVFCALPGENYLVQCISIPSWRNSLCKIQNSGQLFLSSHFHWKLSLNLSNGIGKIYNNHMTDEELRIYLETKKDDISKITVYPRELHFLPQTEFITTIVGPRRSGKTYTMFNLIKENNIPPSGYIFLNFEDVGLDTTDSAIIERSIVQHTFIYGNEPEWIFLDEIQNLLEWQKALYSIYEKKRFKIVVSGSTSKLTSKEIASGLRGRSVTVPVFPLSLKEVVKFKGFERRDVYSMTKRAEILRIFSQYLQIGGFPQLWFNTVNPNIFFQNYVETIVYRDIVERYRVKNPQLFRSLLPILAASNAKEVSIKKLHNTFASKGVKLSKSSFYNYIYYLQEIFLVNLLKKIHYKERESLLSVPKIYFSDTGLVSYLHTTSFERNWGRLLENIIFLELYKKLLTGDIYGLFYWKSNGGEVDFVVKKFPGEVSELIQVTYATTDEEIEDREIKGIMKAKKIFSNARSLIITWNFEGEIQDIECISAVNWILEN